MRRVKPFLLRFFCLAACILLAIAPLSGCGRAQSAASQRYEAVYTDVFDTVTQIVVYAPDQATAKNWAELAHDRLAAYHRLFDIYHSYGGVGNAFDLNAHAGDAPVPVDAALLELVCFGKRVYQITGGKVNIAMGSVLSLWHTYRDAGLADPGNAALPPAKALSEAAAHTDIARVLVDEDARTVCLDDEQMRLDLGAVAKGYAVERTAAELKDAGVVSMLLNVGGNVRAIGNRADGKSWRVAVQSPFDESASLCVCGISDSSLVTSGVYQRYYTVAGERYHHIIDPDTLMPGSYFSSVSVLCPDSGMADALSTALFIMPYEEGLSLVEALPDTEAMWVEADGTRLYSGGFEQYIVD